MLAWMTMEEENAPRRSVAGSAEAPRAKLYHFPLSHFCEKARWAFDYKGADFESIVLLPGPHRFVVKRLTKSSATVPVAEVDGRVLPSSDSIIDYLEQRYPEPALTPKDAAAREQVLAWEHRLDVELGVPARRVFYDLALPHSRFVIELYTKGAAWWGKPMYFFGYRQIARVIRKMYSITEQNVNSDRTRLRQFVAELDSHLSQRPFLTGDVFTRADMTLAALMGPLLGRSAGLETWPPDERWPAALLEFALPFRDTLAAERTREWYRRYRRASADATARRSV